METINYQIVNDRLRHTVIDIIMELELAMDKFPPFNSNHEGYAVILEELEELWDFIKSEKPFSASAEMREEAIQVAAMAIRFILDRCHGPLAHNATS